MAQLRLIALAAGALAACRASEAGVSSGISAPSGWKPLPELAQAASEATARGGLTVDGSEGWGDPARGCYGAWVGLRGTRGAPSLVAETALATLPVALPGAALTEVVKPAVDAESGILSLAFARGRYHGRVRAQLARSGAAAVVACFWNEREPVACESACTSLLGSMK